MRQPSPFFRNVALFGYFEGGKRLPPPNQGNILRDAGWFWYIPLSDTLTSVGAVVARECAGVCRRHPEGRRSRDVCLCQSLPAHRGLPRRRAAGNRRYVFLVADVCGDAGETIAAQQPASSAARDLGAALSRATEPDALDDGDVVLTGRDTRLLGQVPHEATELQVRVALGEYAELLPASKPPVPGGLTATPDGLRWRSLP